MTVFHVSKKFNIKLTYKPPFLDAEDIQIGQLWEYQSPGEKEPHWFHFAPKTLRQFDDFRLFDDGRDSKEELLQCIKTDARKLIRLGYLPEGSKLLFSMLPVEQVF